MPGEATTLISVGTAAPSLFVAQEAAPAARSRRITIGVAATAAVIAGLLAFGGDALHEVTGSLSLSDSDTFSLSPGDPCTGEGGYDDIRMGNQVVIEDASGRTLATSALGQGEFDGLTCLFAFTIENVPEADFYHVWAGSEGRGGPRYSYEEMVDDDWAVHLTLG